MQVNQKTEKKRNGKPWHPHFKCKLLTVADAKKDKKFDSLVAVLKAANRAIVHINKLDVDRGFKTEADHEPLFDVIDWIENLIQTRMYEANDRRSLSAAMQLPNNVM